MYYIGIDVGLSGSICILGSNGELVESIKMPIVNVDLGTYKNWYDIPVIAEVLNKYTGELVLEYQRPIGGCGVQSTFRLARGFGLLEGIAGTIKGTNLNIVDPKTWQNYLIKKYIPAEITDSFKKKTLNLDISINSIPDSDFKLWYSKYVNQKSISSAKARSAYLYYAIVDDIDIINYKNNGQIDAYLIAYYCYLLNS